MGFARRRRVVELALVFTLGPVLLALGPRWLVTVGILASGVIGAALLVRDPTYRRRELVDFAAARSGLVGVLARALAVGAALVALTLWLAPRALFTFPRTRPGVWLAVMFLYPLSAYAQEIVFRPLFFHRYGDLFPSRRALVLASGLVFGWSHVVVNNLAAVALASVAGVLFASTYERSRSTVLVTLEHALYGDLVFTIGLGSLFYSQARWVAAP